MFELLPDDLLDVVAQLVVDGARQEGGAGLDSAVLAALALGGAGHGAQGLARRIGLLLDPPSPYERLCASGAPQTLPALKAACREEGLKGWSRMRKPELLSLLQGRDPRLASCSVRRSRYQPIKQQRAVARRRAQLRAALEARGLELRPDSRVCAAFIATGQIPAEEGGADEGDELDEAQALELAVEIADEMDFLYNETDYRNILSSLRRSDNENYGDFWGMGDGLGGFSGSEYWARKEAYQDGLIDDIYDDEGMEHVHEQNEARRRLDAKESACYEWARGKSPEQVRAELPPLLARRFPKLLLPNQGRKHKR